VNVTELINVHELLTKYSVDELAKTADDYFKNLTDVSYHMIKPFASPDEVPSLVGSFGAVVYAAQLWKGCHVLDFGSGSCWSSRLYAQMGCNVLATDISTAALRIGQKLIEELPLLHPHGSLQMAPFNGYTIESGDETFDRIICSDAFHHIVNQLEVMQEFYRVLKPGGIVVLSEPGPHHSLSSQSQFEMRNYLVVERDVVVEVIEEMAIVAGFDDVAVALYSPIPVFLPAKGFEERLESDDRTVAEPVRNFLTNHRMFRIHKPGLEANDSRKRGQLEAKIDFRIEDSTVYVSLLNTGKASWLPSGDTPGAVNLGLHLMNSDGQCTDFDFQRFSISDVITPAGGSIEFRFPLPVLPVGHNHVEIDLVAEHVAWFSWDTTLTATLMI